MRYFKNIKTVYIAVSILFLLAGAAMLAFPDFFIHSLYIIAGALCIIFGLVRIAGYFSHDLYELAFQFGLSTGILSVIMGLTFIFFRNESIVFLQTIIGMFFLISGILKIQSAAEAKKFGLSNWWIMIIFAVIIIALGVLVILYPFSGIRLFIRVLGGVLVISELQNIFDIIFTVKYR